MTRWLPWTAPLFGALLTLSLAPFNVWPLGIASLAGISYLFYHYPQRSILLAFGFGLGLFFSGASWVYASIHDYGNAHPILAALLVAIFCTGMASFLLPLGIAYKVLHTQNRWLHPIVFTVVWAFGEWCRSWLLTGFPWLFVGYGHLETPLAGYMPIASVYGSSMAVALCGAALIWLKDKDLRIAAVSTPLLVFAIGYGLSLIQWTQATGTTKSIGLVQPNYSLYEKWDPNKFSHVMRGFIKQTQLVESADIVVWPESAIPASYQRTHAWIELLSSNAEKAGYTLISGQPFIDVSEEPRKVMNSQWVFNPGEGIQFYFKNHLVPFGEYVPLEDLLRGTIDFFDLPSSHFTQGPDRQPQLIADGVPMAMYICYEIAFPNLVARNSRDAELLFTVSNDAWFGQSIGPLQHFEIARARALESGKPLVRVTNNGITGVIDAKGRVIETLDAFEKRQAIVQVDTYRGSTPFSRTGENVLLAVLASLALLLLALKHAPRQ